MMEFGLIGEKLGHSYSPQIHRIFGDYEYKLYPMPKEELEKTLRERNFRGLNITIPYKTDVLPFCDEISPVVQKVGSANTLVMREGKLCAYNTDLAGFLFMLKKGGISLKGKKVLILGSGGTSLTAQAACREEKAGEMIVVSRSGPVDYAEMYKRHRDAEIIINSTPVGMYPGNGISPVELDQFPFLQGVADVIYNPARTKLLLDAAERKIPCVDGLWMLSAQGFYAARLFLDQALPESLIGKAYRAVRRDCLNLVLCGMPGCGKSTLGKMLAKKMQRPFVDLDAEIEKEYGPADQILREKGESCFRELESRIVEKFGKESGLVIATGGGAILKKENVRALRQNGVVVWVQRPLEKLSTKGRPLSQGGMETLKKLWAVREPLYRAAAHFSIENTREKEAAVKCMLEGFYEAAGNERP